MLDFAISLSFAAADKGLSKATTRAREAAYTEGVSKTLNSTVDLFGKLFTKGDPGKRYVRVDEGSNLNLRSAPGTDNASLAKMPRGTQVDFTGNKVSLGDKHWAEVEYGGQKGWVDASWLKIDKPEDKTEKRGSSSVQTSSSSNADGHKIDWTDADAVRNEFNKEGNHGNWQCADLSKWIIDKHTDLKRPISGNNGNVFAQNIADLNGLTTTHVPCAPAIFSVKEGTYGPGIAPNKVSDSEAGHTGIALSVKDLGKDKYEITYIDTYKGYNKDGYNSNVNKGEFKKSDNVTYVSLEGHLK